MNETSPKTAKSRKLRLFRNLISIFILVPFALLATVILLLYLQQDTAVQNLVKTFNKDFVGEVSIKDSHISPFTYFPHITIDLEDVLVWEGKDKHNERPIIEVQDVYIGLDLWTILTGKFDINFLEIENGEFDIILHEDGTVNVINALSSPNVKKIEDAAEEFHIHLEEIKLKNLDIHKYDEANQLDIETYVKDADARFQSSPDHILIELESNFVLNVIDRGDTTFLRHKHFYVDTHLDFDEVEELLVINPSKLILEHGEFEVDGTLDIDDSLNIDLDIHGNKPNFDLFIAFAPEELIPTLEKYDNAGTIYFEANVNGKSVDGIPAVTLDFGCDKAFFKNTINNKAVEDMHFEGHFENTLNDQHDLSAMSFSILNFNARPEAGFFKGSIEVENFESPEIEMVLDSDFNLEFLAKFLNFEDLQDLSGKVQMHMKFHDIIDLSNPERSIEKLNEAYETRITVENLSFVSPDFHLPIDDLDIKVHMDGHEADIDYINLKIGNSDLHIDGLVDDLPAILHHTDKTIDCKLNITSKFLDIAQLTGFVEGDTNPQGIDEQIENLSLKLDFVSTARTFTESEHLPLGEFFIEDFYADLKHYPHTVHDFHADIFVDENDLRIVDFSGEIDTSDFHFIGKLHDYAFWFADTLWGDTRIEFDFLSDHLRLDDLLVYKGENHIPEEYQHEELSEVKIHGISDLHFRDHFQSADIRLTRLDAKMKVHPLKFKNFNGRVHYEDEHVQIDTLYGRIGKSSFTMDLNYYFGEDEAVRIRDNHLGLHAKRLDFDELLNYEPPAVDVAVDHEDVFNIYDLKFTPMTFDIDIEHLNYHRYLTHNLVAKCRTESNHYIRIDTLHLDAAGGHFQMAGYLDGRDRDMIYMNPRIYLQGIDLDRLLFKFENFGQDHVVSENLHGQLSGTITGKIHMHPDLVPKIDDSELHMDLEVMDGRLANYGPIVAMGDYFGDKNLYVVNFDSLDNHLDMKDGRLVFPRMTFNTSIGHLDLSGNQSLNEPYEMDYTVHIPLKMVSSAAMQKLFGKKNKEEADSAAIAAAEDEVIYKKSGKKRIRYLNLLVQGDIDNYEIKLGKKKKK